MAKHTKKCAHKKVKPRGGHKMKGKEKPLSFIILLSFVEAVVWQEKEKRSLRDERIHFWEVNSLSLFTKEVKTTFLPFFTSNLFGKNFEFNFRRGEKNFSIACRLMTLFYVFSAKKLFHGNFFLLSPPPTVHHLPAFDEITFFPLLFIVAK